MSNKNLDLRLRTRRRRVDGPAARDLPARPSLPVNARRKIHTTGGGLEATAPYGTRRHSGSGGREGSRDTIERPASSSTVIAKAT